MITRKSTTEGRDECSVLLPFRINDRWGYIAPDGTLVIEPQYDSTGACLEGQPYAVQGDEILILSHEGNVKARVEDCWAMHSFQSGLLEIERDGMSGFCNTRGQIVIEPQYEFVSSFTAHGCSACCSLPSGDRWYRIQPNGERFNDLEYRLLRPILRHENAAGAKLIELDRFVIIDGTGQPLAMTQYADARSFSEGLAPVRFPTGSQKMGWIDDDLNVVIPGKFDDLGDYFSDGAIPACEAGLWGLVDRDGAWLVKPSFRFIGNGGKGFWPAAIDKQAVGDLGEPVNSVMTVINRTGEIMTEPRFSLVYIYDWEIARFSLPRPANCSLRDSKPFGYINSNGETIWTEGH